MDELRRLQFVRNGAAAAGDGAAAGREGFASRDGAAAGRGGSASRAPAPPVRELRGRIDQVDRRIAALLQERAALALEVQEARGLDRHGHDVARERELLEQAARGALGPLEPEELTAIFGAILRASRAAQRRRAEAHVLDRREP